MAHPWHDIPIDVATIEDGFPVVIEVPQGSKNKYEIDKDSGLLRLDRTLYSAVHYPADYGFVPRTLCDDGDAIDVLVLGQEPVWPLTIVQARAIGVLRMRDEKGEDDKLIAVSVNDPQYAPHRHFDDLPPHRMQEIKRFFLDYKVLEDKDVEVHEILGPDRAIEVLLEALEMYAGKYDDFES
jgi:inorganic pyrophosphatase